MSTQDRLTANMWQGEKERVSHILMECPGPGELGFLIRGNWKVPSLFFDIKRFQIQFSTWLTNATRHMLKRGF